MILMKKLLVLVILSVLPSAAVPLRSYNQKALKEAQEANCLIILQFFKHGCSPCHIQTTFLTALKEGPDCSGCKEVLFFKVDVDDKESLELMNKVGVATAASLVVLQGDKLLVDRPLSGQTNSRELLNFINTATNLSFKV